MKIKYLEFRLYCLLAVIILVGMIALIGCSPSQPTPAAPTANTIYVVVTATSAPATAAAVPSVAPVQTAPASVDSSALAESHFTTVGVPACTPVNAKWKPLFWKADGYYLIDRTNPIFKADHLIVFEGVVKGTNPLHTVEVLSPPLMAEQANLWDCGPTAGLTPEAIHTVLFEFVDKKYQDETAQGLSKPYEVVTSFGDYQYAYGVKPAWSPTVPDLTAPACPFATPALSDPAGVPQPDGSFVGAPGKLGCDFVVVSPDGKTALRYHGPIDSFPYLDGSHFYLFPPTLDNATVAADITGQPVVTNSWK